MTQASPREVRAYLLENSERLPEGVSVGQRGRLSQQAKDFFTAETGREVVSPATVSTDTE